MIEGLEHMYNTKGTLNRWIPVIGERVGAYMVEDNKTLFFGYGIFMGSFIPPIIEDFSEGGTITISEDLELEIEASEYGKYDFTRPLIRLENGGKVWGNECWWRPADEFPTGILKERPVINTPIDQYRLKLLAEDLAN